MAIPRIIQARLVERLIFNFRFTPDALDRVLPTRWLKPQVCNNWSVVSFCILNLERVTVWPFPAALFGRRTTSCAYRCGAIDASNAQEGPTVYITDRQTDLPLIARLAPWLVLDTMLMVRPKIEHNGTAIRVSVNYLDGQPMFSATARLCEDWKSSVFPTVEDFAHFIKGGVSSYTPSVYGDRLTRVDLEKDEPRYEPLDAQVEMSCLDGVWKEAEIVFDSAARAGSGSNYKWTYRGLASYNRE
jgi:hypothetical protein